MKSKFERLARRITGLSCPFFGVSWNPSQSESDAAKRVLSFLEDRRVLYNPSELEVPQHAAQSIVEIRQFLTEQIAVLPPDSELAANLRAMRAACRKCMDTFGSDPKIITFGRSQGHYASWDFMSAVGQMRGVMGVHIAAIMLKFGLEVEPGLARILPAESDDDE